MISVVVPARRVATTLERAVQSALDNDADQVVIVDDASDEGDGELADRLATDPRVAVVHRTQPGGPAAARNDGLRRATGEYVVFLDGDDRLHPGALATLKGGFTDGVVAVMGRFRAVDEHGDDLDIGTWANEQLQPVVRRAGRFVSSELSGEAMLTRLVTPPPGAIMVRREAALAVGGFDVTTARSEDLDFLVRLSELGRLVSVDATVLDYERRAAQRSQQTSRRRAGRQRVLARLVWRAPNSEAAIARGRGAAAHHLDRAQVRWRYSSKSIRDVLVIGRSLALAGWFRVAGAISAARRYVVRSPR